MKKKYIYLIILLLFVASCAAFGRIAGNDFINFDDDMYVTQNDFIKQGFTTESVRWAFENFLSTNWHPVTWISLILDWSMFGNNASGYHIVNLILHIGAAIFLFLFLFKATNNLLLSALAVAFFTLHPLRVESVAWVSQRKDVLSMFFGMMCLYVYSLYTASLKLSHYLACLALFALSLMSKATLITMPFILLLMDYWPLKRFHVLPSNGVRASDILLREKIPFFIFSIASGIMTVWAQIETSVTHLDFPMRVTNAFVSYVLYLKKIFLPIDLAVFYPFERSFSSWQILGSVVILVSLTVLAIYYVKKLPFLFVGWFWYLGTLVPVSGLMSINAPMADRYTYLPSIGIAIMLIWSFPVLVNKEKFRRKILVPAAIVALSILAFLTWRQSGYWKNSITLFRHTLYVTQNNDLAHNNLANALLDQGKMIEAIDHYTKAITINQTSDLLYFNRGIAYVHSGEYQLALNDYHKAINLKPDNMVVYNNRGIAWAALHQYQKAIEDFNMAISIKEDYADAHQNRGLTYFNQRKNEPGCRDVRKACDLGNCKGLELARDMGLCR